MRKAVVLFFLLLFSAELFSQSVVTLDNGRAVSPREALGQDQPYPFEYEQPVPKAPKGYEPFYIEHYGRHGSRFAYSTKYYENARRAFDQAEAKGVLTDLGKKIKADFDTHYSFYMMRMGDLSDIGWAQQIRLGKEMAAGYPKIFSSKEASVIAVSSDSRRSMMSMAGFCLGLGESLPGLRIRADQGNCFLHATQPKTKLNPFRENWPEPEFPFEESEEQFCKRKTGECPELLSRLFTDPDAALEGIGKGMFVRRLYVLVAGMNSLNPEDRTDFTGVFTPEEFARMWEVDDYQRYHEYFPYAPKTAPVMLSIIKDADAAIGGNRLGATLRFGHDHVVMPLLVLLRINGYTRQPSATDEISSIYANIDSPMAANVQIVFYRSKKDSDILINIRLNGRTATVDGLESVCEGFYRWSDYRSAVLSALSAPESGSLEGVMSRTMVLSR